MLPGIIQQVIEPRAGTMEMLCWLAAGVDPARPMYAENLPSLKAEREVTACIARYSPNQPWVPVAVVALLLAAAVALYWLLPVWRARRSKMVPLDEWDADSPLKPILIDLVATARLTPAPDFVIDPKALTKADAWVFGRWRHYRVCLDAGLATTADTNLFRAVVLHELAHVRNKDVSITYATIALWRVFLVLVLLPEVATLIEDFAANRTQASWGLETFYAHELALVVLIVVSVYLTRASILRNCEIYADRMARRWRASRQAWDDAPPAPLMAAWPRLVTAFAGLWSTHPAPTLRRTSLTDPKALFGLDALTMLLTGLAADILAGQLYLLGGNNGDPMARQAQAILVAALVIGVGGVALWRAVVHAILTGRPVPSGWLVGLFLGLGIAAGELIGTGAAGNSWLPAHPEALLVLVAALVLVMTWTAQCAEWWVRAWPGRSLRPAMLMGLAAASLAFACVLSWWYDQGSALVNGWPYSMTGLVRLYGLPGLPVGHISVVLRIFEVVDLLPGYDATAGSLWWAASLLWLLPLLALAMRPLARCPVWLARAKPGTDAPLEREFTGLRRVWGAGLAGGLVSCAGLAAGMARVHGSFAAGGYQPVPYLILVVHVAWPALVVCSVMALTSAAVAAATESAWLLAGLIAAGITAVLGVVTAFLLGSVDGCLGPLATVASACHWVPDGSWPLVREWLPLPLTLGMLAAGLAAFAGRGARLLGLRIGPAGRHALRRRPPEPSNREGRLPGARITVVVLAAAVATLTVAGTAPAGGTETAAQAQADLSAAHPADTPSASVTRLQALAWGALGGGDLLNGFYPAESAYRSAVAAAGDATNDAQFTAVLRKLSTSCNKIARATQRAAAYFDVPVPAGQQLWSHMLTRYRQWTTACRRLGAHTTTAEVKAATTDYEDAVRSREAMTSWFNGMVAMYLGRVRKQPPAQVSAAASAHASYS
jgi:Zn-dependent protease with chaperone function